MLDTLTTDTAAVYLALAMAALLIFCAINLYKGNL